MVVAKNNAFRAEVKQKIDALLAKAQSAAGEASGAVVAEISEEIVTMICDPLNAWWKEQGSASSFDDTFSADKESWIAR